MVTQRYNLIYYEILIYYMAKYSTGDSGNNSSNSEDDVCSLCGETSGSLSKEMVAGAYVTVCKDCGSNHATKTDKKPKESRKTKDNKSNNKNSGKYQGYTADRDSSWVEETRPDYGNATTPYLVQNYSKKLANKLSQEDIELEELSEDSDVPIGVIEIILNGNAIGEGIGKKPLSKIEESLDIKLQEEI